jgi:hypothetical protein
MKKFRGVFAQDRNWFTDLIYILFNNIVVWALFKLPYSDTGSKIMVWFSKHNPRIHSAS